MRSTAVFGSPWDAIANGLAAHPLPALQELKLALYEPFAMAPQLSRYVGMLPALRRLTVFLRETELWAGGDSSSGDDMNQLSPETYLRMPRIASPAPLQLPALS